ncbi:MULTISPECIES: YbaK/EbsC family protein [Streptomyces]|uniref:YbaK/EbsC family protein n=1 Tax=Streptomyces caniscabiei TaxID=2746961 RepID=A0ABU4MR74_9ACTN|nr:MULTISPECIES: YbaK/EbsC family protein [Streptomyces]MBE4739894.1 YbaK/EbsC family protein [Streptomyces caniscabiei]MBE4758784.1 YbaK/EbsC family protein [Streptomyces caniscabiei]MBE4770115.1 YbaK/EbsC family protein [Streptomyces caniscabiei]MBE4785260.1 YbaK/EbsC family protein [Streptomyces caniscabiei]MBE4797635.1 YbaK/EbsC family protein [Streptomyces caniscabiei]
MTTDAQDTTGSEAHPLFAQALTTLGLGELHTRVRRFPEATRTAADAAAALGCELSEICKSLIFAADGVPVLVLMDGASRVDVELVRRELGAAKVTRARADVVRETTGYAIGGVPPFGHRTRTRVLADRSLLAHTTVWAAAGTPYTVFPMAPETLIAHAGATLVDVRETATTAGEPDA